MMNSIIISIILFSFLAMNALNAELKLQVGLNSIITNSSNFDQEQLP